MIDAAIPSSNVLKSRVRATLLYLAWGQALIATTGSLFFSEVMGFIPCVLCWYQRILMYPLVIVLGVGILLRDQRVRYYVLPLSPLGTCIGLYHNLLYYGAIPESLHVCTSGVPCETRWIEWLGFVGIPFLSFTAFTVITMCVVWYNQMENDEDVPSDEPSRSNCENTLKRVSVLLLIVYSAIVIIAISSRTVPNSQLTDGFGGFSADPITPDAITALSSPATATYSPELISQGQQVFSRQCSACHGQNAQGITNLGLPLVDNSFIQERTDSELLEFIRTGRLPSDPQNQTGMIMPGKGGNPALTDSEILGVIAYLRSFNP